MTTLLFVYNANSGKLNALFDVGHKLFSPSTYPCSLCALTFDAFSENKTWKTFRESSNATMKFYHIDEFESQFPNQSFVYPVVLKETTDTLSVIMNAGELNDMKDVETLIQRIANGLASR